eukprot:6200553-Pleurochrysis_carterae.AAC.4
MQLIPRQICRKRTWIRQVNKILPTARKLRAGTNSIYTVVVCLSSAGSQSGRKGQHEVAAHAVSALAASSPPPAGLSPPELRLASAADGPFETHAFGLPPFSMPAELWSTLLSASAACCSAARALTGLSALGGLLRPSDAARCGSADSGCASSQQGRAPLSLGK